MPMPRPPLPTVGGDNNTWGTKNNAVLEDLQDTADRVDPGVAGSLRQKIHYGPNGPEWRTDPVFDIRDYGTVVLDGATDNLTAVQGAVNAMLAAGRGTVLIPGPCAINGAIQVSGTTVTNVGVKGSRAGAKLVQLADNTPMFNLNVSSLMHSCEFGGFEATWNVDQSSSDTASVVFHLDQASGSFYNSKIGDITFSNCYRFIDSDGQLFWGNEIHNVMGSDINGGFYSLTGVAGQPNNLMRAVYLLAQNCTTTLFDGNALVMTGLNVEVNQVSQGVQILADTGGGDYTFSGEFSIEGGTWASALDMFDVRNTKLSIGLLQISGEVVSSGTFTRFNILRTEGEGRIRIHDELRLALVPKSVSGGTDMTGDAILIVGNITGTLSDPTAYTSKHIDINDVTFYGGLTGWYNAGPWVLLNDMGSANSADSMVVRSWIDPSRIDYAGNAAYTIAQGGVHHVIFNTTLTANRDVNLPSTDFLYSGYKVKVSKNVTGGDVVIKNSAGSTIATLANATKCWAEVTFNRSITDGPSTGWSQTGGGTWT